MAAIALSCERCLMAAQRSSLALLDSHARAMGPNPPGSGDGHGLAVDIIWNTTLVCPWNCAVCCVDAVHVTKEGADVVLRSRGLELVEYIPYDRTRGSIYDQAAVKRQKDGQELTIAEKLQVLDHL